MSDEYKISFHPDFFDTFDGTQEDLDYIVEQLRLAIKGEGEGKLIPLDDSFFDEMNIEAIDNKKKLN